MRRTCFRRFAPPSLLAMCLVAVSSCGAARGEETAGTGGMAVSVVRASRHCFENRLTASGVFAVADELQLRPDKEGLVVAATFVEPGDTVVRDQVLARLISPQNPQQEAVAIRASEAGLVTASSAVVGAYVSQTAPEPLFRIAAKGQLELKAEILGKSLPMLRPGMKASISCGRTAGALGSNRVDRRRGGWREPTRQPAHRRCRRTPLARRDIRARGNRSRKGVWADRAAFRPPSRARRRCRGDRARRSRHHATRCHRIVGGPQYRDFARACRKMIP